MKKSIFYIAIIVIIGICVFFVITKHQGRPAPLEVQQTNGSEVANNSQIHSIAESTQTSKPLSEQPVKRTSPTVASESAQQRIESLSNAVQNYSAQVHGRIDFYGKVIDENNQPVEGASVEFVWAHVWPLPEDTPSTNVISDSEGLFSLTGVVGAKLNVQVSKSGYYYVRSLNTDVFNYSSQPGLTPFQPDPNSPVIFHLRKKGAGVNLISATLNVKMPRDGTPVNVNFPDRTSGVIGQLQLSQIKPPYESWKNATEWSFRMTIPNGGFVDENDEFPFQAPVNGYQPTIVFNFKAGQPDWKTYFTKSYYIVFGNPPRYGYLTVETDITWGGAQITYAVNPDGSQNLEPAN